MAISTRSVRQFGSIFQNQLENFGLNAGGDSIAAARLSFSLGQATGLVPVGDEPVIAPQAPGGTPVFTVNGDPTQLAAGRAAIVSYETDTSAGGSPDALRIVLLDNLAAGGVIYITDRAWNGTSFAAAGGGEGTLTYTAPGGGTPAGTVLTFSFAQLNAAGITLSNAGETIYLYQGTSPDAPTRFLFAADIADGNTTFNGSLVNTGLVNGVNAVAIQHDNATYVGAPTGIAQTMLTGISNNLRWYGNDTDDNPGTTTYSEVTVTDVPGPFFGGNDFVILSALVGGGQSDAMLRIGAEDGDTTAQNLARMFRDNPAFNHVSDVSFDLDDGFFFFVDSDFNFINRIMRGNIADLVSGNNTPTFTQLFATDGQNNGAGPVMAGEGISSMEVNHATNKIVWIDGSFTGDFEGGWEVYTMNYDGTGRTLVAVIDTENDTTDPNNLFGITGIADYALRESTNILYIAASQGSVDGFGNATINQNHIMSVNLSTGVITTLNLDLADPRSLDGNPQYDNGRLDPQYGQIMALDVNQTTGIIYFITQPNSPSGHGGIWSYNPATDDLQLLWSQPSPNAFNTLQTFPTGNMTGIEVDEIGNRIYVTTSGSIDHENDGTPGTNEHDASIHMLSLSDPPGTAPTRFVRIYEPTALGAPIGLEIDYDANVVVTTLNATYTESTNGPGSPAGPVVTPFNNATITDPDQSTLYGAQVAITAGFVTGDVLSFTNTGGITGTYDAATGVVTFTGSGTFAQYQTVLNSIRFTNAGDNPTNYGYDTVRTISVNVFDGLTWGDLVNVQVNIVGINDAPVNTVSSPLAATEDVAKVITGISVFDPDADPAAQDITVTLTVTHGTLTILDNIAGGIQPSDVISGNGTATIVITATQNQINTTLANANGLTFLNTLDFNGVATLTITTNDNGLNGNDPGLTGTGSSEQDQDSVTINIAAVNDAPVVSGDGTEDSATIFEDQPQTTANAATVSTLFGGQYSDAKDNQIPNGGASSPGAFSGIAVTANGSSGATGQWQYWDGAAWQNIGARTDATALLISSSTQLRFNPAANYNGAEPTLTVHLIDNSLGFGINFQTVDISGVGATGGTTAYSTGTVTLSGTITPVNDAPTSTGLNGDAATFVEQAFVPTMLDVGGNAVIADIDSADFDTGTLTVHIGTGFVAAQDYLGILSGGGLTITANTVSLGGTQFATYTGGGLGGGDYVFTFDADATPAAVQALIRAIYFYNTGGDNPTGGTRAIVWTLVDGDGQANGGADTLVINSSVNVIPVNDAPSGADKTVGINEDATYTFATADFGFTDVDGNSLLAVKVTTLPGAGTLFYDADGAGGAAPVAVTLGQFITAADITAGKLTFVPAANGNGAGYASFTFQVQDNGGTLNGGVDLDQTPNTITFNVAAVNDAPTSTNLSGDAASYTEGNAPVRLDVGGDATIADIDSLNFDTGTLTVHIGTGAVAAQDVLSVVAGGSITVGAGTVSFGGVQFATFTGGTGGADLVFTFDPDATPAAVQALVRQISYNNTNLTSPTGGSRAITWTLIDGDGIANGGVDTLTINSSVNVISINSAPSGADATFTINEDSTRVLVAGDFGFNDAPETNNFAGVVITTVATAGTLFYDADGAGGAAPVAVTNGQFVTAADIAAGKLTYVPALNANGNNYATFTFQVRDDGGTANGGVDTDQTPNTITFNVSAVNDAPVITTTAVSVLTIEDNGFNFSGARVISVSDVDATTLTVTLTANHGTLSLSGIAGLSFSVGDGTSDATMTFSGTAASINTALNNLRYDPTANYNGFDIVQINVSDNGQTGTGGTQTANRFINVTIDPVNDAPAGTDNTLTGSEDDPLVFTAADFGFTDPNDSPANTLLAVKITTLPALGTLFLDADGPGGAAPVAVVAGQFISVADINAGHFYFLGAPDGYGSPYANFQFQVQDNGGTANGGVNLDPTTNLMSINLTPDNLPPVVDLNGAGAGINYSTSYTEDSPAIGITSGATVIDQDAFPNGGSLVSMTVTLTDRVAGDSLAFGTPLPGGFTAVVTSAAGSITITVSGTGTGAQYASILNSIVYQTTNQDPTVGGTDPARTITVTVNDGQVDSAVATTTVNIIAVDDLPVAQPDAFTITESGTINGASLFANNGSGPDTDPDGPPLSIGAVNGSAANVGNQITLASGALLTVNANGTFNYNPNGAFDSTPTAGSGASNTPAHDSFTYTLVGGNTVTVSITLTGLDTNDVLLGTAGADVLIGGIGNDTYFVNAGDTVVEAAGQGYDYVVSSTSYVLGAGTSVELMSTDNHAGTAAINLTGNELANIIIGNAGANILNGGGGADILQGLGGNDTYFVDADDTVLEAAGGGYDYVVSSTSYVLAAGASVELMSTTDHAGTAAINLTGNELANIIIGNAGANILNGGGGGADILQGLGGNDTYFVDADDTVLETAGGGYDYVVSSTSYVLAAGASVELMSTTDHGGTAAINLTGNELANIIVGNAGNNILDGGQGADILQGLGGNDTYYVDNAGDQVLEAVGGGNDSVFTSVSYTLGAGQEIELLLASNFSATTPLNLTGNEFDNTIYGNDGANILDGKGGNDLLIGQGGADTFAFTTALGANNVDVIFGFTHGTDKIALDHTIFTQAGGIGGLNANAFVVGPAAGDLDDRIIYNSLTGQLFYDADGSGAGAAVQFATLSPGLTLTASDFQVI